MSTRGVYGFRKDGMDKLSYNHFDSYPGGLGMTMAGFAGSYNMETLCKLFDKIRLVPELEKPTPEEWQECAAVPFLWEGKTQKPLEDTGWYGILHRAMGKPRYLIEAMECGVTPFMLDSNAFIKDSLFCEHGYIINLDTGRFEYWKGFQTEPDPENRYGTEADEADWREDAYYPCKMLWSLPLDEARLLRTTKNGDSWILDMTLNVQYSEAPAPKRLKLRALEDMVTIDSFFDGSEV